MSAKNPTARMKNLFDKVGIVTIDELMEQAKLADSTGDKMTAYLSRELMTTLWAYESAERRGMDALGSVEGNVERERRSAEGGFVADGTWLEQAAKRYAGAAQEMDSLAEKVAHLSYLRKIQRGEI